MPALVRAITRIQDADDAPTLGAGQDGFVLTWDNASGAFVAEAMSGGGGTPGGSDTHVQFNDGGAFGGDAGLVYDKTNNILTVEKAKTSIFRTAGTGQAGSNSADTFYEWQPAAGGVQYWDIRNDGLARFYGGLFVSGAAGLQVNGISGASAFRISRTGGMFMHFDTAAISIYTAAVAQIGQFDNTGRLALGGTHTPTAALDAAASTTTRASLRIRTGVAPTSPNDGDVWQDGTSLFIRINGVTKTVTVT